MIMLSVCITTRRYAGVFFWLSHLGDSLCTGLLLFLIFVLLSFVCIDCLVLFLLVCVLVLFSVLHMCTSIWL